MTVEELEAELAETHITITHLVEHNQMLAEVIRSNANELLPFIRKQNEAYKAHADFLTKVEEGMRAYVERTAGD